MGFNADDFVAALEPPAITIQGTTYTGTLLSLPEAGRLMAAIEGKPPEEVIRLTCAAVGIPAEPVLGLPVPAALKAIESFLEALRGTA